VVIFSQGYELYHGTASNMAASQPEIIESEQQKTEEKMIEQDSQKDKSENQA